MGKTPRNAEYTRAYNRNLILRRLRRARMSRADLARDSGLTRASVSVLVDELISEGIVMELEPVTAGRGRTPAPLAIRRGVCGALGIYLNRDGCRAGLLDLDGTLVFAEPAEASRVDGAEKLKGLAGHAAERAGRLGYRILGIGVSAPGPVDAAEGRILNPPGFQRWHNVRIRDLLGCEADLPVRLENNSCSLAQLFSERMGLDDLGLLVVDSGVGSGVISGGKLLHGAGGFTSELGHTTIAIHGRPCACGGEGCLEAYAAIPNLLRGSKYRTWGQMIARSRDDPEAAALLEQEADYLAAGIVNLVNVVNVETICLTGDIYEGIERLRPLLEERLRGRLLARRDTPLKIDALELNAETQVAAAATPVLAHFLEGPN